MFYYPFYCYPHPISVLLRASRHLMSLCYLPISTMMLFYSRLHFQPDFLLTQDFYSRSCQDQLIAICRVFIEKCRARRLWIVQIVDASKPPIEITSMGLYWVLSRLFISIAPSLNSYKMFSDPFWEHLFCFWALFLTHLFIVFTHTFPRCSFISLLFSEESSKLFIKLFFKLFYLFSTIPRTTRKYTT